VRGSAGDNCFAQAALSQASREHEELLEHGEGRMNPDWEIQGMTELALAEARALIPAEQEVTQVHRISD